MLPISVKADEPVRVGAIYPMSGNVAQYGTWASKGARLALAASEYPIELLIEDSSGEGAKGVSAYQKLRAINQVPIVSTAGSSVALAVKPLATRDKILQIDISSTAPTYGATDGYQFRTGVSASLLAAAAGKFIGEVRGQKRIECLYIENEFGQGMFDIFRGAYSGEIASSQTFRPGDTDFRTQILKLRSSNVSAIWVVGHARETGLLVAQARQLGLTLPFISDVYSIESPDFFAGGKDAGEIIYLAPQFDRNSSEAAVRTFLDRYRKAYDDEPTVFAAQAYDAFIALAKVLRICGGPDPNCLPRELRNLDFAGASGRIKFDIEGNVRKELEVKTIISGQFVVHPEYNKALDLAR